MHPVFESQRSQTRSRDAINDLICSTRYLVNINALSTFVTVSGRTLRGKPFDLNSACAMCPIITEARLNWIPFP